MSPYREALIDALIDGWEAEKPIGAVANRAAFGLEIEMPIRSLQEVLGVKWIQATEPTRSVVHRLLPTISDMLWAGRKTETVRNSLRRKFGGRTRGRDRFVAARSCDKRHDWQTVK